MKKIVIAILLLLASPSLWAQNSRSQADGRQQRRPGTYRFEDRPAQGRDSYREGYRDGYNDRLNNKDRLRAERNDRREFRTPSRRTDYANVHLFEFEIGTGFNLGLDGYHAGMNLYVEPRFNIPRSPIDVSLQLGMGYSDSMWESEYYYGYSDDLGWSYHPTMVTFVDYNWRKWRHVSMFAGLGLGLASVDAEYYDYPPALQYGGGYRNSYIYTDRTLVLNPRFGVEFWNRLRLTAEYKFMKSDYSWFGMTVGVAIGGGRKR